MSRRFDGVDDLIQFGSDTSIDGFTSVSMVGWFYLDAFTTIAGMRPCGKLRSLNVTDNGGVSPPSEKSLQFFCQWSGDDGIWYTPTNSVTTGVWTHFALTYNGSATTNDPIMYLDGVSQTITEVTAPTGTLDTDAASNFVVGNNATPGVRPWDGMLAEIGYYNRILTAAEVSSLAKGFSPLFIRNGLKVYAPLIGNNDPELNPIGTGSGTVTGATKDNHPRIIYPAGIFNAPYSTAVAPPVVTTYHPTLLMLGVG